MPHMSIQRQNHQSSGIQSDDVNIVLSFAAVDRTLLSIAGGKGANLGEMARAGLPVPAGFCVTTAAYALVAEGAGLESTLAALATTPTSDIARLAELATAARSKLLEAPVPATIT